MVYNITIIKMIFKIKNYLLEENTKISKRFSPFRKTNNIKIINREICLKPQLSWRYDTILKNYTF